MADNQGIIPTNSFGNIDLYAPTMLPEGAVHLPCEFRMTAQVGGYFADDTDKGIAKVAKHLGISYAEACVSLCFPHDTPKGLLTR